MPNVFQNPSMQNASYGADTRNIGYKLPGQTGPWDNSPQNSIPGYGASGTFGSPTGGGGNAMGKPGGFDIQHIIQQQLGSNALARQQNQQNWTGASNYLKQYATPFSPDVIARMQGQNAMLAQGGANNAFREQQGLLSAGGQGDASSMAAASSEANRMRLGAQVGANNDLAIKAAQANNQAGFNVGNSIIGNLPQYRPDDYSGLGMLGLMGQNQQFQQSLLQNQMDRPMSPMAARDKPIGGRFDGGYGGGGNMMGGNGYASYNPAGVPQANQWGNGAANGNDLTKMYGSGNVNTPWSGNTEGVGNAWINFQNGMAR